LLQNGGGLITALTFFDNDDGDIGVLISSLQINLSTTFRGPDALSPVFAENVGSDETVVLGPRQFLFVEVPGQAYTLHLDRPFFYDPSVGNLLLDVRNLAGGSGPVLGSLVVANYPGDSSSNVRGDVSSAIGTAFTDGVSTRFTVTPVPEPAALTLLMAGGMLMAWRFQRRR
jgi:hypothetical protein